MKDKVFKELTHSTKGYKKVKWGQELSIGYKPDVVLQKNKQFIILESEVSTSRKGYIGGMVKAAKFLTGEKTGILVYVIVKRKNTTPIQISRHLKLYFDWLKGLTNLESVYIIEDKKFCEEGKAVNILGANFIAKASKV